MQLPRTGLQWQQAVHPVDQFAIAQRGLAFLHHHNVRIDGCQDTPEGSVSLGSIDEVIGGCVPMCEPGDDERIMIIVEEYIRVIKNEGLIKLGSCGFYANKDEARKRFNFKGLKVVEEPGFVEEGDEEESIFLDGLFEYKVE